MKVSISGLCRNAARDSAYKFALSELCKHLKELRDDPSRHSEFFALYVFGDDAGYRAKLSEAGQQPATSQGQNGTAGKPQVWECTTSAIG